MVYLLQEVIFKMIKGVVFDLDHTLFDRYATLTEIAPMMFEHFKKKISPGLGIEDLAVNLIYADKNYICFGFDEVVKYLNNSGFFRKKIKTDEFVSVLFECFMQVAVPFPYTNDVLEKLRSLGYKTGLITNGSGELQRAKLKLLGLEKYFDEIIICGELGFEKPDPLSFKTMAELLDASPNQLLYVGDNPVNDIVPSRKVGYIPVWVKTGSPWLFRNIQKCAFEIDTVEGIFDILDKLKN